MGLLSWSYSSKARGTPRKQLSKVHMEEDNQDMGASTPHSRDRPVLKLCPDLMQRTQKQMEVGLDYCSQTGETC